jgi:hypothetical protein
MGATHFPDEAVDELATEMALPAVPITTLISVVLHN